MCKSPRAVPNKIQMRWIAFVVSLCANAAALASPGDEAMSPDDSGDARGPCLVARAWDRTISEVQSWPDAAVGVWRRNVTDVLAAPPTHGTRTGLSIFTPRCSISKQPAFERDWTPLTASPTRVVLLLHGLDERGPIWDDLAPELAEAGRAVARFDYPNDQSLALSAAAFRDALAELKCRGAESILIITHSMGGLVARDALTSGAGADWPRVERLITVASPNSGSAFARFRVVLEVKERLKRLTGFETCDWRDFFRNGDGDGQAGHDLLPGSVYLRELNARPLPDVPICVIAARITEIDETDWSCGTILAARRGLGSMTERLGDGVVSLSSASLPGADEFIVVRGDHRSLLRRSSLSSILTHPLGGSNDPRAIPAAIPVILDRLERD